MSDQYQVPRVGVGTIVLRDGKVLLGKRRSSHGEGEWATPGGKLDYKESVETCARRELTEEAGIEIENLRFGLAFNSTHYLPKHFIGICMVADWKSGEPQVFPEENIVEWGWFELDKLPEPMFHDNLLAIEGYKKGIQFIDAE